MLDQRIEIILAKRLRSTRQSRNAQLIYNGPWCKHIVICSCLMVCESLVRGYPLQRSLAQVSSALGVTFWCVSEFFLSPSAFDMWRLPDKQPQPRPHAQR